MGLRPLRPFPLQSLRPFPLQTLRPRPRDLRPLVQRPGPHAPHTSERLPPVALVLGILAGEEARTGPQHLAKVDRLGGGQVLVKNFVNIPLPLPPVLPHFLVDPAERLVEEFHADEDVVRLLGVCGVRLHVHLRVGFQRFQAVQHVRRVPPKKMHHKVAEDVTPDPPERPRLALAHAALDGHGRKLDEVQLRLLALHHQEARVLIVCPLERRRERGCEQRDQDDADD
mmetsp:Transcript_59917/g.142435  ORF Transcript_59917/g.142435 Transcript_59917/m.142435 type:complete len:227 (-) Transcript_59917:922-1602(-)